MKKLFVHLSVLCLLAALMVPMVGCKNETEVDDTATTGMEEPSTTTMESLGTDMGTGLEPIGTDMGTGTTEPTGTDMTPPPAQ